MAEKERNKIMTRAVEYYRNFGSVNENDLQRLLKAGECEGNRGKLIEKIAKASR